MEKSIYSDKHGELAELLRSLRLQVGLTQTQVADRLGRHHPFVHDYETGQRRLDVVRLRQIAGILDTTLTEIAKQLFGTSAGGQSPRTGPLGGGPAAQIGASYDDQWTQLCAQLRAWRNRAGLTEVEVARRLDEPQSFVSKYENMKRRLDLIELEQVATALDTTLLAVVDEFEYRVDHGR